MPGQQIPLAALAQVRAGHLVEDVCAQPPDRAAELGGDFGVMAQAGQHLQRLAGRRMAGLRLAGGAHGALPEAAMRVISAARRRQALASRRRAWATEASSAAQASRTRSKAL